MTQMNIEHVKISFFLANFMERCFENVFTDVHGFLDSLEVSLHYYLLQF